MEPKSRLLFQKLAHVDTGGSALAPGPRGGHRSKGALHSAEAKRRPSDWRQTSSRAASASLPVVSHRRLPVSGSHPACDTRLHQGGQRFSVRIGLIKKQSTLWRQKSPSLRRRQKASTGVDTLHLQRRLPEDSLAHLFFLDPRALESSHCTPWPDLQYHPGLQTLPYHLTDKKILSNCHLSNQSLPHQGTGLPDRRAPHECYTECSRKSTLLGRDFEYPVRPATPPLLTYLISQQHHEQVTNIPIL